MSRILAHALHIAQSDVIELKRENDRLRFLLGRRSPEEIIGAVSEAVAAIDHLVKAGKITLATSTGCNTFGNLRVELKAVLAGLKGV